MGNNENRKACYKLYPQKFANDKKGIEIKRKKKKTGRNMKIVERHETTEKFLFHLRIMAILGWDGVIGEKKFNSECKIYKKGNLISFIKLSFSFFCLCSWFFGYTNWQHDEPKKQKQKRKKDRKQLNNKTHNSHRYYPFGNLSAILIVSLYNNAAYVHVQ